MALMAVGSAPILQRVTGYNPSAGRLEREMREPKVTVAGARLSA